MGFTICPGTATDLSGTPLNDHSSESSRPPRLALRLRWAGSMPSHEHEAFAELFRARPALVVRLLGALGIEVGAPVVATLVESTFAAPAAEYHADVVVELREATGTLRLLVIVEVQLTRDPEKRRSWPTYEALAHARHRVDACVLVVSPDPGVARWASTPVRIGPSGSTFVPLVLGPSAIPVVSNAEEARAMPELAVLSAVAHGNDPDGASVALAAVHAVSGLHEEQTKLYLDLMLAALDAAARRALEALMDMDKYEYRSDFARKYVAQGRAEGKAAGIAEGIAKALLQLLAARGVAVSDAQRVEVLACRDVAALERWFARAVTARTIDDVLAKD